MLLKTFQRLLKRFEESNKLNYDVELVHGELKPIVSEWQTWPAKLSAARIKRKIQRTKKRRLSISVRPQVADRTQQDLDTIPLSDLARISFKRRHLLQVSGMNATLIVPPDPWTLLGSKGDHAMIECILSSKMACPEGSTAFIVTATHEASLRAHDLGIHPLQVWHENLEFLTYLIHALKPDRTYILGADCMDGYYNPQTSCRLIDLANATAAESSHTTILGFSFNQAPSPIVTQHLQQLSPKVHLKIRDPLSAKRFRKHCPLPYDTVADVAFLLHPFPPRAAPMLTEWIKQQQRAQNTIIGFNLHFGLLPDAPDSQDALIESSAAALTEFLDNNLKTSVLLFPHDTREQYGDLDALRKILIRVPTRHTSRYFLAEEELSAAEVKYTTMHLHALLTGRMHLAIAALGQFIPVAVITYQGKFEGLLKHYEYPHQLCLSPHDALNPKLMLHMIEQLIERKSELQQTLHAKQPLINQLASHNFQDATQHCLTDNTTRP